MQAKMDREECNAPMTRKSRQNYIEDHWDKSGAVDGFTGRRYGRGRRGALAT